MQGFRYTQFLRAIGATVSAGALHAQGWGFESLIAHHLIDKAPSDGGLSFLGSSQRDSNPTGCGAEETRSVFQRSTRGPEARSGSGRRQPHATSLIAHHLFDNGSRKGTVFVWAPRRGIRTRQGAELRNRVSVFQRSTRGAKRRSGSGRRSRMRHPSSPTI